MSEWDVLNIAPTSEKRVIKQAYAVLLKQNKPDENPEGFARLHSAYQFCLSAAKDLEYSEPADVTEIEQTYFNNNAVPKLPSDENTVLYRNRFYFVASQPAPIMKRVEVISGVEADIDSEVTAHHEVAVIENNVVNNDVCLQVDDTTAALENFNEAWLRVSNQVNLAFEKMRTSSSYEIWSFLEDEPALYDLEFKMTFSDDLFNRLVSFFELSNLNVQLRKQSLRYLNGYFKWDENQDHLAETYGEERVFPLLDYLSAQAEEKQSQGLKWICPEEHQGPLVKGDYFERIAATFVDLLLCYFLFQFFGSGEWVERLASSIALYFSSTVVMEALPFQGSLGKIFFGLKVVSKKGKRLNIFHAFCRQVLFWLSTAAFKITVLINALLGDRRMLHDRMSFSIVVKR